MKNLILISVLAVLISCNQNDTFVTESGVEVTYLKKGGDVALIKDSIAVLKLKLVTDSGTVLTETSETEPLALAFDPEMEAGHLQDVLSYLKVGDSVSFSTSAKNLFEETYKTQVPPDFTPETVVNAQLKLEALMSRSAYQAYYSELMAKQKAKDAEMLEEKLVTDGQKIDAYLAENNIEAQTSESGLRYVITEEGTGATAAPGDEVTVHYDGRLLSGEAFDSSRERGEPFTFTIGQGRVIKGWDEGIAYIKAGGKGTLFVPSPLGYGSRAAGEVIQPYSILVFDVEVLNVEKSE